MEYDFNWLVSLGIDINAGEKYTGGQDRYVSALQRFYKAYEGNCEKIEKFLDAGDYDNYKIIVHSLKSNALMIGAVSLGKSFEMLEKAAAGKDVYTIEDNNGIVLENYKKLIVGLTPIGEMKRVMAADEITADEAQRTADELLEALDEFDDELSTKLVKKLSGYPFRLTQREKLNEAASMIEDFMYEEAADLIKEIYDTIE